MDPNDLAWISQVDIVKSIAVVLCIAMLAIFVWEKFGTVIAKLGITTKSAVEKKKHEDEQNAKIQELRDAINNYKTSENSTYIDLSNCVNNLTVAVNALSTTVDNMNKDLAVIHSELDSIKDEQQIQKELNASSRKAQYKEILYKAYYVYKNRAEESGKKEWTEIEYDGFWTMFRDYEKYDSNSFLHTQIEPYMRQFIIVNK